MEGQIENFWPEGVVLTKCYVIQIWALRWLFSFCKCTRKCCLSKGNWIIFSKALFAYFGNGIERQSYWSRLSVWVFEIYQKSSFTKGETTDIFNSDLHYFGKFVYLTFVYFAGRPVGRLEQSRTRNVKWTVCALRNVVWVWFMPRGGDWNRFWTVHEVELTKNEILEIASCGNWETNRDRECWWRTPTTIDHRCLRPAAPPRVILVLKFWWVIGFLRRKIFCRSGTFDVAREPKVHV